ncbi:hypothetical protein ACN4FE_04545 [Aliarcobacter butzleri]|uniref:hypothetical protein n=1 Tax=Aliarcobacter butzleri TaxID=28197 RepID=UPI003AF88758
MEKLQILEKELEFEKNKSEIIQKKITILNKIVSISFIFIISIILTQLNNNYQEFDKIKQEIREKIKDNLTMARERIINGQTQEIRKSAYDLQIKIINEQHFKFEDLFSESEKSFSEKKDSIYLSIELIFFLLLIPYYYFYNKLKKIEDNILNIQKKIISLMNNKNISYYKNKKNS